MSQPDHPSQDPSGTPVAPAGARPDPVPTRPAPAVREPRPRGGGSLALAVLLSLIAVAVAGYVGWQQWLQIQTAHATAVTTTELQTRVGALETTLVGVSGERTSLNQRLNDAAAVNRSLREELLGQAARTRNLEDAVAKLAERGLSGHDATLLDETDSLLRMASERYTLFHDAQGAAAAYTLADQTLAAVNDGAFSTVRQGIDAERDALAKSEPIHQVTALQQLSDLRGTLPTLPLKSLDNPNPGQTPDVWTRIRRAVAGVFSVQRDSDAPLAVADARFARELAALDLAQAQAALLAFDGKAYTAALQRADVGLSTQFDDSAPAVQQARSTLKELAATSPTGAPVPLGAALTELRNLRAVHALTPSADAPAPAASSGTTPAGGSKP
jgi:uroporphyrin-3 C-methyltransferase